MIKQFVLTILYWAGLRKYDMRAVLKRLSGRNIPVHTILDIGASDGCWSLLCKKYFDTDYFLIEANPAYREKLEKLCKKQQRFKYVIAAAGEKEGDFFLEFQKDNLFGGTVVSEENANTVKVGIISLNTLVKEKQLSPPFLLKLDTHGFEIPILKGAEAMLKDTHVLIIEVYNYQITPDSLKFYQLCAYLENLGFYTLDMAEPTLRPYDHTFWQMDLVFARKELASFSYHQYK